jgi:hypothetical protein
VTTIRGSSGLHPTYNATLLGQWWTPATGSLTVQLSTSCPRSLKINNFGVIVGFGLVGLAAPLVGKQ